MNKLDVKALCRAKNRNNITARSFTRQKMYHASIKILLNFSLEFEILFLPTTNVSS